jgi:hypothetical protein
MNIFSLPVEIQDYIYEFDGRYKSAMKKTLSLIEEWGKRKGYKVYQVYRGPFEVEIERRAKMYDSHFNDGVVRLPHRVIELAYPITTTLNFHYNFKDVFGVYYIWTRQKHVVIDGDRYTSCKFYHNVTPNRQMIAYNTYNEPIGTPTRESRFYLLDPEVQKKLRQSKDPVSAFLKHGFSPKGKRSKIVFK